MKVFKKRIKACSWTSDIKFLEARGSGGPPKFKMSPAYNGGKLSVKGFDAPVVIELSSARFEKDKIKINAHHDALNKCVGHAEYQEINANGIFLDGLLSKVNTHVDRIVEEAENDFPHEASIEANLPVSSTQFVPRGQEQFVNGQVQTGPFYFARDSVITGVAILDLGADRFTNVSIAAELNEEDFSMELNELAEKHGIDLGAPGSVAKLQAAFAAEAAAEQAPAAPPAAAPAPLVNPAATAPNELVPDPTAVAVPVVAKFDDNEVANATTIVAAAAQSAESIAAAAAKHTESVIQRQRDALIQESQRVADVKQVCAEFDHPEIRVSLPGGDQLMDLQAHAIETGMEAQEVKFEAMKWKLQQQSAGGHVGIHDATQEDMNENVIECSLALSAGLRTNRAETLNLFDEKTLDLSSSSRYRGMKPSELVNRTLRAAGMSPCTRLNNDYIKKMRAAHMKLQASGFTTLSVPGILSNVASKTLLAAYRRQPSFIPFVFGRTSKSDFKPSFSYQLQGDSRLLPLGKDGEIKHGSVTSNEYIMKLETHARMLAWTREDMINDDLGALGRTAEMLGEMSFKAREFQAAQFIIMPTPTFWVNNENSFTGRAFSIAGLTESENSFNGITDDEGLPISVGGGNVLLPHQLKVLGSQLKNQTEIRDPSATGAVFTNNPHSGMFDCLATPWINNAQVNPNVAERDTTWYRFADPASAPALEVSYLNGVDTPTIESDETDFNTLGMQFRCYFDFGFGANDNKYAQRNIG